MKHGGETVLPVGHTPVNRHVSVVGDFQNVTNARNHAQKNLKFPYNFTD